MSDTEDPVVANRRSRLKLWIDTNCGGSQKLFIASTNDGEKQINQGELSGLLRSKSFGEKRARALERQARMPSGYLDANESSPVNQLPHIDSEIPPSNRSAWPFKRVPPERLSELKRNLGEQRFIEAIADMEEQLESTIIKWERRVATTVDKSAAA
ncbi:MULTISPECIES: hypothetical protein [unclassified Comamonas]|uniref:hypothetical protein n=1 Tax=unclassified Comamonas TaxID=2638500 RepID=UPI001FA7EAC3|nr:MULTISPECIES: hypothetical protein [unclassified Comamonas]UNV91826.1 hypothetical protein MP576_05580 [Comamonas sp. 7D-2evo1]UNV94872.1 hypothetical protein MPZ60_20760 [Comamonas sp. 7D-2]UNW01464.1 hypothetical protein MP579_05565 [Comamonas sp. 7D-2evo2]